MMDAVPPGWEAASLRKLGKWVGGGTPSKAVPAYWAGSIPWVSPKDMKTEMIADAEDHITEEAIKHSATSLVPAGSVLMVTRSGILAHSFPVAVAAEAVALNQDLKALVPHGGFHGEYVAWALRRYSQEILGGCSKHGTTVHSVETSRLLEFEIPVAPSAEQRRIVDKIDELFSLIEAGEQALERARKLLERYRQSVLNAAVTGALTKDWREQHKGEIESGEALLKRILKARREAWEEAELAKLQARGKPPTDDRWKQKYKEPQPPDTTNLFELPEGWVWTTLPMLGEFGRGKSKHRPRNDPKLYGGEYPFIQTGDVRHSIGGIKDHTQTYNNIGLSQSKLWPIGTICITIAANIAETGILQFEACFPDSIVGLVPSDAICGQYIDIFLNRARQDIERYAPATAQKNINLEILADVAIPTPSLGEQDYISDLAGALLSVINHLEQAFKDSAARSSNLRQSILAAAFAGKLVPQDPADEPAAVLLERIRAGRAVATGSGGPPSAAQRRGRPRRTSEPELPLVELEPPAALGQADPGDLGRGAR